MVGTMLVVVVTLLVVMVTILLVVVVILVVVVTILVVLGVVLSLWWSNLWYCRCGGPICGTVGAVDIGGVGVNFRPNPIQMVMSTRSQWSILSLRPTALVSLS